MLPNAGQPLDHIPLQTTLGLLMITAMSSQCKRNLECKSRPKTTLLDRSIIWLTWVTLERAPLIEAQVQLDATIIMLLEMLLQFRPKKSPKSEPCLIYSRSMEELTLLQNRIITRSKLTRTTAKHIAKRLKPCKLRPWPRMRRVDLWRSSHRLRKMDWKIWYILVQLS